VHGTFYTLLDGGVDLDEGTYLSICQDRIDIIVGHL
jgi:hypothetical protein